MAHTKITCRLVPRQDPDTIRHLLRRHVERHVPAGVEASVDFLTMNGKPYVIPQEHWGNAEAREVLVDLYGQTPYYVPSGGSIPICGAFLEHLKVYTVNLGLIYLSNNYSPISCSQVMGVTNVNAPRRAAAPVPRAGMRYLAHPSTYATLFGYHSQVVTLIYEALN